MGMEALIMSCGTGGGHNSAAKAILEEMHLRGHRATILNPYTLYSSKLADKIDRTYVSMVQNKPRLFGAVYSAGQIYRKLPCKSPVYYVNRRMVPILEQYLSCHHYDVIFMTHLYAAEIITNMKDGHLPIPKTIFIATDYVCIPFTEETECDAYVVPARELVSDYTALGIPKEKIYPFGIPTSRAFAKEKSKEEARKQLHLDPHKKYILIAGGSMGGGTIRDTMDTLIDGFSDREDVVLLIVCGTNQALYDALISKQSEHVMVIGYTDGLAEYLHAADLFITKPGGLSSTEAAVCGIPIVHTAGIPGCESYNAEFFQAHGMSVWCRTPAETLQKSMDLLFHGEESAALVKSQQNQIEKFSAEKICCYAEACVLQ